MAIFNFAPCLILIIALVVFGLEWRAKSGKAKDQRNTAAASTSPKRKGWIVYAGIAFIISFWTAWGALFFLAVVWVLQMHPKPYSPTAPFPSDLDRDSVKSTYTWLWISPVLTIPTMLISTEWLGYSINNLVLAALIPLIFHTPLLFRLNTKSLFVYRHAQLAILLVALRAAMAALALNTDDAWVLFIFGNGSLWFFGTLWARNQAVRKECWLMQRNGEQLSIPPDGLQSLSAQKHVEKSREFIHIYKANEAKKHALAAFRSGDREIKSQAVKLLETLDEVEKF